MMKKNFVKLPLRIIWKITKHQLYHHRDLFIKSTISCGKLPDRPRNHKILFNFFNLDSKSDSNLRFRMKSDIDGNSNRGIVAILLLLKGILCAGYFELFDLLHHLRPISLLAVITFINTIVLCAIQRPWNGNIQKEIRRPLFALGFFEAICSVIWIYSIYIAGPLRVMLITEFPSGLVHQLYFYIKGKVFRSKSCLYRPRNHKILEEV